MEDRDCSPEGENRVSPNGRSNSWGQRSAPKEEETSNTVAGWSGLLAHVCLCTLGLGLRPTSHSWAKVDVKVNVELVAGLVGRAAWHNWLLVRGIPDQVADVVVHQSVISFVCSHDQDHIPQASILRHVPILDRDLGSGDVLKLASVHHLQHLGVGMHRLLLEVAREAVGDSRSDEVEDGVGRKEANLSQNHQQALVPSHVCHFHECHEVHPLVLRFVQGRLDPIAVHITSKSSEVVEHGCCEARHSCNGLKHAGAVQELVPEVHIAQFPEELHDIPGHLVPHVSGLVVGLREPVLVQSLQNFTGGTVVPG
mmetsp:Transcript_96362/g.201321  ORF Transcript_96362/g.201321 Transcript_96362/m.201321 type:complete len:311 (-) Transcript_96362:418-1350(-)